ncbi:unnamed protein product [Musa acuminata subsp. burmannicoides]
MFDRISASYNSLVAVYAHRNHAREALAVLSRMLAAGLRPTRFAFAPLLSLPSLDLDRGIQLHSLILKSGFLHADPFSGTALLGLYARNGRLDDAFGLFEEMPTKTVVTWNSTIAAFSRRGFVEESMFLFRRLLGTGMGLTECSFLGILCSLRSSDSLRCVEQIHGLAVKTAMDSFLVVANALLNALSTCSGVLAAERFFNSLQTRDVVSWNTMMTGFAKSSIPERALELFFAMHVDEVSPSGATIATVINACTCFDSAEYGELIHAKAIKRNLDNDMFVASSLIDYYANWKRLQDAHKVFDELPVKNVVCWNALISGYSKDDPPTCLLLLKSMLRSENRPNELSFSSMLTRLSPAQLQQLHSLIIRMRHDNNEYVSSALIASYDSPGISSDASSSVKDADPVATSTARSNATASVHNRAGRYQEAQELLLRLQTPDTMSWNILLNACARNRGYSEALLSFKRMQSSGHSIDNYTAVSLVSICSRINSLELGRSVHGLIVKTISGCMDTFVCNVLLDMYAKCGNLDGCLKVFDEMGDKKNLVSWTALISGLGLHGCPHEALARFKQMESEGFEPDRVAFLAVLSACRHGGLVEEGMLMLESMKSDYGIEPEMDHYVCVVDLLCKCGHLKKAELVISGMPFQPNAVLWRTFLRGCKTFGDNFSAAHLESSAALTTWDSSARPSTVASRGRSPRSDAAMNLRQRPTRTGPGAVYGPGPTAPPRNMVGPPGAGGPGEDVYNIIPIHNLLADHPCLRFPEVRAAMDALRDMVGIPTPLFVPWHSGLDLLDWLGISFGFQRDNVRNQREHLVLLLANAQMRLQPPPDNADVLVPSVVRHVRKKLLHNYTTWCAFLGRKPHVSLPDSGLRRASPDPRRELLYVSLYLLVWGEAANLRFLPECLSYIFHNMAMDLNRVLEGYIDDATGQRALPVTSGENGFLTRVVTPIYLTIQGEVEASRNGTAPNSAWRNYDDINEYFWSNHCFERLRWPLDRSKDFFLTPPNKNRIGKTGFVEQRSFWNLFRSFDRLWVMLILFLQAAIIVAWRGETYPWQNLQTRDDQVRVLTIFITWAGLRLLQSILDAGTQYSLVSSETKLLGVRMVLKSLVAITWTVAFSVLYSQIWEQRNRDRRWSQAANQQLVNFLEAAAVFILPELLAIILFILPWLRNFLEKTNWRIFYMLTWWFQSRIFIGRGLREGLLDNLKYAIFWIALLSAKFSFSYFLQIKPMVAPTKAMLELRNIEYEWHEFFSRTNRFGVVILWLPVILIYLMDIQIWYSIFSSFVGALVGLFSHLGEIRDVQQLRLRFQFFASAMKFNLMPEEQPTEEHDSLRSKFRDAVNRLKLRYGLGRPYKKIESNEVGPSRFALIWNEIIQTFREEDILSDREVELLELPPYTWKIRVIRWPCILLCNELLLALSLVNEYKANDRKHWRMICKNEYRRCAIIEVYDSIKSLLLDIINKGTEEHSIVARVYEEFDNWIRVEKFSVEYNMFILQSIYDKLVILLGTLVKPNKDRNKVVHTLQTLYDIVTRDFPNNKKSIKQLKEAGLAPRGSSDLLFENAIELPNADNENFYKQVRRLHTILTSKDSMNSVPKNLEARRRIAFFSNSLFMNMPRAPKVEKMRAFSVLTPYYNEEVLYSKEQLHSENEDGISIIFYLQKIYEDDWANFLERMHREGMVDEEELWNKRSRDLRLWASYRGQTLSRTVRGMMYYYRALKMLTFLDNASEIDISDGSRELASVGLSRRRINDIDGLEDGGKSLSRDRNRASSGISLLFKGHEHGTAMMKYTYVLACQIYGNQKAKNDARASDILYLMKNNEALRVAYVDEKKSGRDEVEYYSVLVRYDQQLEKEVEIYRVRLPGPLKLGEGKPENQNHALIFTRGDAVQTIDMNQDNYFEEALKMRNLLEEYSYNYGARKPTILGVREHVFTGSVSSLAWFMSAQETSFVTLGQRVLANPLKVRMHYGHPDVFDRLWFLSRGGISKASRVINISEDIFAGFNCTLRGGNVTHHEYIQVGKGRDVGLNQISMFEAKVASGNGEQTLSRDVYRLGHRLDFFRMLSFFYTTVGFYFNTMMVVLTVYAYIWGHVYLALSGLESSIKNIADSTDNAALGTVINQQFIIQLGLFTALPMVIENSIEHGFLPAIWDFLTMQLQLASMFYTFSLGTKAHYYGRTILHGGAKYRATGRGFVVEHKKFAENYRLFSRSHFIKAIEIGVILTVYASYSPLAKNTFVYIVMTISSWFLVVSWILAPFAFNPSGFDWLKTVYDFDDFMTWIWYPSYISATSDLSWEKWWNEENDHLRTTGLWGKLLEIILDLRYFLFQYGIVYQLKIADGSHSVAVYLLSWICIVAAVGIFVYVNYARDKYAAKEHITYRAIQSFIIIFVIFVTVLLLEVTSFEIVDIFTSLLAFIPTGWGLISIAQVIKPFIESTVLWETVVAVARLYDIMFGLVVMAPVAFLSWMPGFQEMQTRILFNEAFSRGLQISRILTGKKSETI